MLKVLVCIYICIYMYKYMHIIHEYIDKYICVEHVHVDRLSSLSLTRT